jgi:hypothetical protein
MSRLLRQAPLENKPEMRWAFTDQVLHFQNIESVQ